MLCGPNIDTWSPLYSMRCVILLALGTQCSLPTHHGGQERRRHTQSVSFLTDCRALCVSLVPSNIASLVI